MKTNFGDYRYSKIRDLEEGRLSSIISIFYQSLDNL